MNETKKMMRWEKMTYMRKGEYKNEKGIIERNKNNKRNKRNKKNKKNKRNERKK